MDTLSSKRFYGIYEGVCIDNQDPAFVYRIRLKVPQILGDAVTNWAKPCLPVTDNSTHTNHTDSITSGSGGTPSHTHSVTLNAAHSAHNATPNIGQKVWVMFIAGDPNFPVWLGVEL